MVDDEGVDGAFGGLEFEAELFLQGGGERGVSVGLGAVVEVELDGKVVGSSEAGLCNDGSFKLRAQHGGDGAHGEAAAINHAALCCRRRGPRPQGVGDGRGIGWVCRLDLGGL